MWKEAEKVVISCRLPCFLQAWTTKAVESETLYICNTIQCGDGTTVIG